MASLIKSSTFLVATAVTLGLAGSVLMFLVLRKKSPFRPQPTKKFIPPTTDQSLSGVGESPQSPDSKISTSQEAAQQSTRPEQTLSSLVENIDDANLREYLVSIAQLVEDTDTSFDENTSIDFCYEIIDRLDDLRKIISNQKDGTAETLSIFRSHLVRTLKMCGVEIINSPIWDPSIQRAIEKQQQRDLKEPIILYSASYGIRRNGQLVRKEEVILAIP